MNGYANGSKVVLDFSVIAKWIAGLVTAGLVGLLGMIAHTAQTVHGDVVRLNILVEEIRREQASTKANRYTSQDALADDRVQEQIDSRQNERLDRHDDRLDAIDKRLSP